ncbi:MAG: thermonuclease family protein [Candidatus Sericytochromatia bacterium]|nr:thermonuclease family protein [Candidatus Sericytochromatia bacterium]
MPTANRPASWDDNSMNALLRLALPVFVWLAVSMPALAADIIGTCIRVSDGDTIAVQVPGQPKPEKIRLLGIDCPEVAHSAKDPGQEPWGTRAADFAKTLMLNKQVRIETDVQTRDKYGRMLGYVFVGKTFVNLELVKAGHAMLLTYAPNVKYVDQIVVAQREARNAKRGIWSPQDKLTESPHTYRHNGHQKGNENIDDGAAKDEARKPARHPDAPRTQYRQTTSAANGAPGTTAAAPPAAGTSPTVMFHTKTHKFHEPGCQFGTGVNLKEMSRANALSSGGIPCKACHPN